MRGVEEEVCETRSVKSQPLPAPFGLYSVGAEGKMAKSKVRAYDTSVSPCENIFVTNIYTCIIRARAEPHQPQPGNKLQINSNPHDYFLLPMRGLVQPGRSYLAALLLHSMVLRRTIRRTGTESRSRRSSDTTAPRG